MQTKNNVINRIQDLLGSEGSRELAEKIYNHLDDHGGIERSADGLHIADGVDLLAIAEIVDAV